MGNICPWCCKDPDDAQSNNNLHDSSSIANSQRSLASTDANERTRLLGDSHRHSIPTVDFHPPTNAEPTSSYVTQIVPPLPPPPLLNDNRTDLTTGKVPSNEPADPTIGIVDRMLPDLIDVGGWGVGTHQTNSTTQNLIEQNDHLRQILSKSLQSTRISPLPDAGPSNLSSLLSSRPISPDICHYVAQTANDLSSLLIDEIKIVHKEDLVVTFE